MWARTCDGVAQVDAQGWRPHLRAQRRDRQEAQAAEDDEEGGVRHVRRVCQHDLYAKQNFPGKCTLEYRQLKMTSKMVHATCGACASITCKRPW